MMLKIKLTILLLILSCSIAHSMPVLHLIQHWYSPNESAGLTFGITPLTYGIVEITF